MAEIISIQGSVFKIQLLLQNVRLWSSPLLWSLYVVCTCAESILCHLKDAHQEAAGQSRVLLRFIISWEWVQIHENLEESCEFTSDVSFASNKNHVSRSEQINSLHSEQQWWRKWGKCIPVNWLQRPSYTSSSCGVLSGLQTHTADCCLRLCVTWC